MIKWRDFQPVQCGNPYKRDCFSIVESLVLKYIQYNLTRYLTLEFIGNKKDIFFNMWGFNPVISFNKYIKKKINTKIMNMKNLTKNPRI